MWFLGFWALFAEAIRKRQLWLTALQERTGCSLEDQNVQRLCFKVAICTGPGENLEVSGLGHTDWKPKGCVHRVDCSPGDLLGSRGAPVASEVQASHCSNKQSRLAASFSPAELLNWWSTEDRTRVHSSPSREGSWSHPASQCWMFVQFISYK